MADNVAITAGSGTNIATDDVSGVHYQRIKLHTSEDASAEGIGDDDKGSQRSLWVTERPNVGVTSLTDSAGLTTATTAYTIGDTLGSGWSFTNMARATGGTGTITSISLIDVTDITASVTLFFSKASITFGTDNAAPSVSDSDAAHLLDSYTLFSTDLGGVRLFSPGGQISIPYVCDATTLYVYAITNVAHTFYSAVTDLKLRLFYRLD